MVAVVKLRPAWSSASAIVADPGRPLPSPDVVQSPTSIALFDLPDLGAEGSGLALHLAAASASAGWKTMPIETLAGGVFSPGQTAARETVLGRALGVLPLGQPNLLDLISVIEVELVDPSHWLVSGEDAALAMGFNLAVLGRELLQFGVATPVGPGRFRLSRLLRGRRGTEWAMGLHAAGEAFAMLQPGTLQKIALAPSLRGSVVEVRSVHAVDAGSPPVASTASGEALRPPAPVHLQAFQAGPGALQVNWTRRSRDGWAWLNEIDAPLGESAELYSVSLEGSGGRVLVMTSVANYLFDPAQLAAVGTGAANLTIQQIGDQAASHAASLAITLS